MTTTVDRRIAAFLGRHHLLTVATVSDAGPWCASCFYAYDAERNVMVISSDAGTRHGSEMGVRPQVAVSVALETKVVGKIQGIQIEAVASRADESDRRTYLGRFPYAAMAPNLELWRLDPKSMKLTDNTLGFGSKIVWNAQQE